MIRFLYILFIILLGSCASYNELKNSEWKWENRGNTSFLIQDTLKIGLYQQREYLEGNKRYSILSFKRKFWRKRDFTNRFYLYNISYYGTPDELNGFSYNGYLGGHWQVKSSKGEQYLIFKNIYYLQGDSLILHDSKLQYRIEDKTDTAFILRRVKN